MKNHRILFSYVFLASMIGVALMLANFQPTHAKSLNSNDDKISYIELHGVPVGAHTIVQWRDSYGVWNNVEGWRTQATSDVVRWSVHEKDFNHGPFRWVAYDYYSGKEIGVSSAFVLPDEGQYERLVLQGGHYYAPAAAPGHHKPAAPAHGYAHQQPTHGYAHQQPTHSYGYGGPVQKHSYPSGQVRVLTVHKSYQPSYHAQPSQSYHHNAHSASYNQPHYQHEHKAGYCQHGYNRPHYQQGYNAPHYQHGYNKPHYQQGYSGQHGQMRSNYGYTMSQYQMPTHRTYGYHR